MRELYISVAANYIKIGYTSNYFNIVTVLIIKWIIYKNEFNYYE